MSHNAERKEKICLNCGAFIYGRYCHKCGQENVEPKETFWHLVTHFTNDVTHFDGKFFSTAKYLLFKPGFLSEEYVKGRRMSYLNPIRMYVFTSAIFFIFFFSVVKPEDSIKVADNTGPLTYARAKSKLESNKVNTLQELRSASTSDSDKLNLSNELKLIDEDLKHLEKDTSNFVDLKTINNTPLSFGGKYTSVDQYDSAQSRLPVNKRDSWLNRRLKHRKIALNQKYGHDSKSFLEEMSKHLLHMFPQLLFVSLPLIALVLGLLYRRRKNFFYVDHVIYLVHLYCAMFIFLFIQISFKQLQTLPHLHWVGFLKSLVVLYMLLYLYKSMRKFYQQRRAKTIFKFSLLLFISSILLSFLVIVYGFISLFTV